MKARAFRALIVLFVCLTAAGLQACNFIDQPSAKETSKASEPVFAPYAPAADRTDNYFRFLEQKRVGVIANRTSQIEGEPIVNALIERGINVRRLFAPEHGFDASADAGAAIADGEDKVSGLQIYSLYGETKKPSAQSVEDLDVLLFDIQDVGVRFYTYLSTLHYVMESCAENNIPLVVLDRPNPNGHYIDGPVLDPEFSSFVGLHPVPIVYGMTIGEYALMINGQGWLSGGQICDLSVVPMAEYDRSARYDLPIPPSPNLPNARSIAFYPSLALFEGTVVSIGRGTDHPFQIIGHPEFPRGDYAFTPTPNYGASSPKLEGELCRGYDLSEIPFSDIPERLDLSFLTGFYANLPNKDAFFLESNFFNRLAGNDVLMRQITQGSFEDEIRESWQDDLSKFRAIREKYLIYDDVPPLSAKPIYNLPQ